MLELKEYSKPELSAMFGTRSVEGLKRKFERYGVDYEIAGRGENAIFTIKEIANPFKLYCITELGFDGNTDFSKVRNFYNYFFNDEEFMAMPDEVKEYRMRAQGQDVSRQTIARYVYRLDQQNLIDRNTNNFLYYFAYKHEQFFVDREEYIQSWHEYWDDIEEGLPCIEAICKMIGNYGGVARKQAIPEVNAIYLDEIEYLRALIQESLEAEVAETARVKNDNVSE